jgi:LemA protein
VILLCSALVLVFWVLGAYNRLVRLRSQVVRSLQALMLQWRSQAVMLNQRLEQFAQGTESESQWAMLGEDALRWRPLALSARQFLTCLAVLEAHPQHIAALDDISAVRAAREIFESHWRRLVMMQDDLAGTPIPPDLHIMWAQHESVAQEKCRDYNSAVHNYHEAIRQFPAIILAWLFGFGITAELG